MFLAAFSGLYFTVYAVTDETYRKQFFTGICASSSGRWAPGRLPRLRRAPATPPTAAPRADRDESLL